MEIDLASIGMEKGRQYETIITTVNNENLKNAGYENLKSTAVRAKKVNGVTYIMDKKGNIVASSGERLNKRIYTMEEATTVAGQKNKVMIRYK